MSAASELRAMELFDYAADHPDGFTVDDLMGHFAWDHRQTNDAIRQLRLHLGEFDSINLPCTPQGSGERWLYRLVGNLDGVRTWATNRVGDTESRLRTMDAMMRSIVKATDGRTTSGRVARAVEKALRRLVEDIDEIVLNGAP